MESRERLAEISTLGALLPAHQFAEHHSGVIDAPPDAVWDALMRLKWTDLRLSRPLMAVRGLGSVAGDQIFETFRVRAGAVFETEAPVSVVGAMVGKPWSPVPQHAKAATFDEIRAFTEPGWLKYGMEWVLHPLSGDRTLLETRTLCQATDASARRKFRAYWLLIRAGSGAMRMDMIAAVRRMAAESRG